MPYVYRPDRVFLMAEKQMPGGPITYVQRFTRCGVAVVEEQALRVVDVRLVLAYHDAARDQMLPLFLDVESFPLAQRHAALRAAEQWAESDADLRVVDWRLTDEEGDEPRLLVEYTDKVGHVGYCVFVADEDELPRLVGCYSERAAAEKILENPTTT